MTIRELGVVKNSNTRTEMKPKTVFRKVVKEVYKAVKFVSSRMEIPFVFTLLQSGLVHGLAFWFDVAYLGSK